MDKLQLILIFYDLLFYIESALRRLQLQCVSWMLRNDGLNGLKSSSIARKTDFFPKWGIEKW